MKSVEEMKMDVFKQIKINTKPIKKVIPFYQYIMNEIVLNYKIYNFPKDTQNDIAMIGIRSDLLFVSIGKCLR